MRQQETSQSDVIREMEELIREGDYNLLEARLPVFLQKYHYAASEELFKNYIETHNAIPHIVRETIREMPEDELQEIRSGDSE